MLRFIIYQLHNNKAEYLDEIAKFNPGSENLNN